MKIKLKIRQKILLFVLTSSIFLYVISIGYIIFKSRTSAYNEAIELTQTQALKSAGDVAILLEKDLSLVRTLAESFVIYDNMETDEWLEMMHDMYLPLYKSNPHFFALWDSWEYKYFKPGWDKDYGRYSYSLWKENGKIKTKLEERSLKGDPPIYGNFKQNAVEAIWEPYLDNSTAVTDRNLMASLCVPTIIGGEYRGMVGVDIILNQFQKIVESIHPFKESYAFLISNTGIIAGHPDGDLINQNVTNVFTDDNSKESIVENIQKGEPFDYISRDRNGLGNYFTYAPVHIGETGTPWSLCIVVPLDEINAQADQNFKVSMIIGIVVLLLLTILLSFIAQTIARPIVKVTKSLKQLASGEIDENMILNIQSGDEIEEMSNALNKAIEGINNKNDFANNIGQGNLDVDIDLLGENDELGKSLKEMQQSLIVAKEEEGKLKAEDEKRRWTNEGLAMFGDILRQNYEELTDLSYNIIRNLVKYLNANQGGLFVKDETLDEEDKPVFLLDAAFAFDRRKYMNKEIEMGEGLVGTCAIEKETIYITDIPEEYIEITSGLGGATPKSILIVPLRLEEEVYGVMEIASFNAFAPHEVEFVEKLGESIASTISNVKVNARTAMLLEKSQQQAEEMAAQEEEMRQNLEELQATQEEMARKRAEGDALAEAVDASVGLIELDYNKRILDTNDLFLSMVGLQEEDLFGKFHIDFISDQRAASEDYARMWESLRAGAKYNNVGEYTFNNKIQVFKETFVPVRDENDEFSKVYLIVSELKK